MDFPVTVRKSNHESKSWETIRVEQKFDMGDRQYKVLQPPAVVEWGGMVSKILLLPSSESWPVLVTFSVIFCYVLTLYCMFFVPEQLLTFMPYYAICDFIYFFDLILNLLHRFLEKLQQQFHLRLTRTKLLVVDTVSLLPQEGIFGVIFGFDHWTAQYCRVFTFIRLYRVFYLFGDILGSVRSKRWTWFLVQYVILFSMVLHTAVCIWHSLSSTHSWIRTDVYWTTILQDSTLNVESVYDWYIICTYVAISFMSNTGFGDFFATRLVEGLYCISIMFIGFMLIAVLIAVLTAQLINVGYRKAEFSYQLDNIKNVIKQINVSPELSKQVLDYYSVLWTKKDGVDKASELYLLPAPLRMELMYDINIAHLQNSLLFKNQPEPLLRKLSLLIQHVFLLPGDVFFHQGVVKGKMVFIASGVLEILSDEDDQSPIISFKAGTVLGEVSLLMTVPAKATVRAATYAELQVIERQDFMRMMVDHPDATADLRQIIHVRLEQADAELHTFDKNHVRMNLLVSNVKEFRPIKLLKNHLSNIVEESDDSLELKAMSAITDDENREHSSSFSQKSNFNTACLSLYKLVPNVTMIERPRVCVSSNFPWILHPRSSLVKHWNNVVNVTQVFLCIVLPYHIVYVRDLNDFFTLYGYLADGIYLLDIYVRCSTAVVLRNRTIRTFNDILSYRMKYLSFYVDVFSLFPIEVLAFAISLRNDDRNRFFLLFKLNRMLRIWRVREIFASFEKDMCRNVLVLALIKFGIYLVLSSYWTGAILYMEGCLYPVCTKGNWFYIKMMDAINMQTERPCYEHPVAMSTYFGTMVLFLVGYGDIVPNSSMDIHFVCVLVLLGIFLVCYATAQLCSAFSLYDRFRREFQDNVVAFGRFLEQHNLVHSLHKRVITFFRLQWYYDQGTGRDFLINSSPPFLRSALQSTELKEALSKTPLFEMVDVDFLIMIAEGAKVQVLPPDEVVAYAGDMSREMHIILSGHCQILNDSGDVLDTYGSGAQFGALEMVYGIPKRYTTRTATNCKVVSVDYRTYVQAMSKFPTMMQETKLVMEQSDLVQWVHRIDDERLHAKVAKKKTKKRNITQLCLFAFLGCITGFFSTSFIFTINRCIKSKGQDKYWEPFAKMKKFRFIGCLLMPLTIHPGGPFLRLWCFIRVISIMTVCFLGPYYIAVIPYSADLYWIVAATDFCAYLDMYLLLHVAYYNEKGLLITHPRYTAKHYLTRSFIIDLLAVFPFSVIVMWENPKHNEGHHYITHLLSPHVRHCTWHFNVLFQFHRIHELFQYLEGDILKNVDIIRFFKFIPLTMVIINLIASLIFGISCTYNFYTIPQNGSRSEIYVMDIDTNTYFYGYLNCTKGTWIEKSQFGNNTNPLEVYLVAIYWIANTLLSVGTGDVSANEIRTMYIVIFTTLFGRLLFAYVFANLIYGRAQFSSVLAEYQENLRDLMTFFRRESVDYHWQNKLFEYFEYVWKKTAGVQPQELCQKLNTALMEDTVVFLYEKTLREVPLFENVEKSFIRVIAKHLTQEYFLKGDTVIRCFDVQKTIYIIYRGKVEVLSSYNEMIACMGPGGLFGNIRQVNAGCRSVSIIASRNLDVLVISSETFYNVIKDYPRIKRNMNKLLETITDFIMPTSIIDDDSNEYSLDMSDTTQASFPSHESSMAESSSQVTPRRSFGSSSAASRLQWSSHKHKLYSLRLALNIFLPHKWFKFAIFPDNIIVKITDVAVLLVSYYDILIIAYCFVTQTSNNTLLYCSFALETIFYFKIFLHFHVAFMDRHGNYVGRFKKIVRHYFTNHYKVFWDVVPNLPVEPLYYAFPEEHRLFALTVLRLIHLLRIQYMLDYFKQVNKQLMANLALNQIMKIVLFFSITVHIFSCTWLMIACPFDYCLEDSWVSNFNFTENQPLLRYAAATYYIMSLTTTTGLGDIFPNTMVEMMFSIIVMFICRFLTALVIGLSLQTDKIGSNSNLETFLADIVTVIYVSSRSLVQYEYRIYCLQDFLRNQNLSDHQMEKLWGYMRNLWMQEKGQHIPKMLKSCPYVLKCDIMNVMYGQHLRNSFLFQDINEALLRQLAVRLTRTVFFKGNYIVQHGDIDQNMYFIHSGEVSVLTVHPNLTETQHELLKPREMFGLAQGLYHGVPHHFSFRANTAVSILVLNLDLWYDVLRYFPEDKNIIYNRAQTVYVNL